MTTNKFKLHRIDQLRGALSQLRLNTKILLDQDIREEMERVIKELTRREDLDFIFGFSLKYLIDCLLVDVELTYGSLPISIELRNSYSGSTKLYRFEALIKDDEGMVVLVIPLNITEETLVRDTARSFYDRIRQAVIPAISHLLEFEDEDDA